ncbi:DUF4238 domain-containing protein [Pseudomonas sp. RHF3.3-3]|uniref:DUF4238 domain-containing protein n=1 Tax=Pseudomonas sp. RHF3.3-3 TaxID=3396624 RepID=UPI003A8B97C3
MAKNFSKRNHYVPQWYQKRFFENKNQTTFNYLDLNPGIIIHNEKYSSPRKALNQYGTEKSFKQDHLYTIYFGETASDAIEKIFFGKIDKRGEVALPLFSDFTLSEETKNHFLPFARFLCAQLFRTPKMLNIFSKLSDKNFRLSAMLTARELHLHNWASSIWEIVSCENSATKFIISDAPVTTYNRKVFPASREVLKVGHATIGRVGTRTIFPLSLDKCLIITPAELIMKPKGDPLRMEDHINYYKDTTFNLKNIIHGRQIDETEVIAINFILKTHSKKYIASTQLDWLYPEKHISFKNWSNLGGDFFLHPDPRSVNIDELVRLTSQPAAIQKTINRKKTDYREKNLLNSFRESINLWESCKAEIREPKAIQPPLNAQAKQPDYLVRITYEDNLMKVLKELKRMPNSPL